MPQKNLIQFSPAWILLFLAPAIGELVSGSAPPPEFFRPLSFLFLTLLYGCGAVLIREIIFRWEKGWGSLLLLGAAYGFYEEGIVVRSFFDPNWMDLGALGEYGRVWGVNWVWVEHLTHYHTLISIAASITLVELFHPHRRQEAWLKKRGWFLNSAGLGLMIPIGYLLNPYQAPLSHLLLTWAGILICAVLACALPRQIFPPRSIDPPHPWRFWMLGFGGLFSYFMIVYGTSEAGAPPFPITMILLLILDGLVLWVIQRWSGNGASWDDRHRYALVAGGLTVFVVLSPLTEQPLMVPVGIITGALLVIFYLPIRKRSLSQKSTSMEA